MKAATVVTLLAGASSAAASSKTTMRGNNNKKKFVEKRQFERALSGSGDINFDDDFWAYDQGSMDVVWDDYALEPHKCMI